MALVPLFKQSDQSVGTNSHGIALFMVLAAISILTLLVSEFVYIAQISQMIAFGGMDQAKAHYLAKSGLKLSLLRLKGYQQIKGLLDKMGPAVGAAGIPKGMIEKIWSFPFFYPIPTNIPGIGASDKAAIETFQKESNIDGKFSAVIESESSKYNLNQLLPSYQPSPTPSATPTGTSNPPSNNTNQSPSFDPAQARQNLATYINTLIANKSEADPDFAQNYRDFRVDDFVDVVASWIDRTYQRRAPSNLDKVSMKKAPFYSITELHMLPNLDDELYNLFNTYFTTNTTSGININTMKEPTLRALVPNLSKDEVTEFFKYRDSQESDNLFSQSDKFFDYLNKNVAAYKSQQSINDLKKDLENRGIQLITEETQFKITVRAEVGIATRTIEAWVTLGNTNSQTPPQNPPPGGPLNPIQIPTAEDPGLRITFMKIY